MVRSEGSLAGLQVGEVTPAEAGFRIIGAHSDSPNLRVKPRADLQAHDPRPAVVAEASCGGPAIGDGVDSQPVQPVRFGGGPQPAQRAGGEQLGDQLFGGVGEGPDAGETDPIRIPQRGGISAHRNPQPGALQRLADAAKVSCAVVDDCYPGGLASHGYSASFTEGSPSTRGSISRAVRSARASPLNTASTT